MLSSIAALNTSNKVSIPEYDLYNPLLNQNFNNFNTDEKVNLRSHKNYNYHNSRLSQDSTLISFQKLKSTLSHYNQSLRKISERTLLNLTDDENNVPNLHPLTDNILALYAKYIHYLHEYRSLGDIDDLQYTILSSKFFQTNVSDPKSTRRVFSIPIKESIINLKPKTPEVSSDICENILENNIVEMSSNSLKTMHKLDTISVVLKIRKVLNNHELMTPSKIDTFIKTFDLNINHNMKVLKKNQLIYKQYLANFIKNLDSFNHKIECIHKKNEVTQQMIKSSITPIMIRITMAIEKLLEKNINLSSEFWSFYVPMYLSLSQNGIRELLKLDFDMKINEYLIKFRKLIQLFLLFLIPSNNEVMNKDDKEIWEFVIPGFSCTPSNKGYLVYEIIKIFNDINLKMINGKNMLNDNELIDWFKKKQVVCEDNDMSLRSDTYEYSELMQRIPLEENNFGNNLLDSINENFEKNDCNNYTELQTTLNNIITSMKMNSTASHIDDKITEFLNQWTAFKLNNGKTYNTNNKNAGTPELSIDPFADITDDNVNNYVSTPRENADTSLVNEFSIDEPIKENTFLNKLKTLSDVELSNKLQLKLKELHIENMQNQETKFKKASQLHLKQINLIDKREKHFRNLKEDDISSYFQMDYLKVYK